jgi:predicted RNA-binding Zn ribbon-like protein
VAIRRDFGFIGRLCLDFAQTGDMGYGARFERLTSPAELARWMSLSPFGFPQVRIGSAELNRAKTLRGAIWRIAEAVIARKSPKSADIGVVNRTACAGGLVRKLNPGGKSFRWYHPTIRAALAMIAQDAVALFGDRAQRKRLRRCNNPGCIVIFYDDSRPGRRRWCAPNRCGDRIRAKSYRERQRS